MPPGTRSVEDGVRVVEHRRAQLGAVPDAHHDGSAGQCSVVDTDDQRIGIRRTSIWLISSGHMRCQGVLIHR